MHSRTMRAWSVVLGTLVMVIPRAIGFSMDRSKAGATGPAIWSDPSLNIDKRASIKVLLNGQLHAADLNNILRDAETEKSANKEIDNCSSSSGEPQRAKRSQEMVLNGTRSTSNENIVFETNEFMNVDSSSYPKMETSIMTAEKALNNEAAPRNVVLLLIDDAGIARETMWKNFETSHKFAFQGFLKSCRIPEPQESTKYSLNEPLAYGGMNEECACERFLHFNVDNLLSWARSVNNMNIATVSSNNFSAPSHLGSEGQTIQLKEAENSEEANPPKQDVPHSSFDIRNGWRIMDLDKQSTTSLSSAAGLSPAKQDGMNGYDGMWDVFDMFSRIRIAFFRILLDSLGNLSGPEDEFAGRRTFPAQPSVVQLVNDTVKQLKSVSNKKGFMLIAIAPINEMSAVVDVVQREISIEDTLLVVTGVCSETNEPIPFFAEGHGGANLREALTVWDLPECIRSAISNGCPGKMCSNERRPVPVVIPSLELLSSPQDLPRKRIARAKDEEEMSPETGKRSGSGVEKTTLDAVAAIVGIATSVTAMLALNS